jgi:hypothetical protein
MTIRIVSIVIVAAALTGCAGDKCLNESDCNDSGADAREEVPPDLEHRIAARSSWEGTPEGVAVLAMLNDESTTLEVLDTEVPLDRRAAGNLIAHRDGGDRLWGTTDDDVFSNMDEVDAVRFVGPKSIDRLVLFANTTGWVPGGEDLLGVYDGVSFTVVEAEATLEVVNDVPAHVLDIDFGLDARAVDSIMRARPVETVDALSRLYYVGGSALRTLKAESLALVNQD